ncbi:MAG: peptidoglycan-binding protein [Alphaproteobacteria bacterium]|nr:peptidoglycan-binding protein [Alphaproteobacteria bacterium]
MRRLLPPLHEAPAAAGPDAGSAQVLRIGAAGPAVSALQRRLGLPETGVFGSDLEGAVRTWQRAHGVIADGEVGPETRAALVGDVQPGPPRPRLVRPTTSARRLVPLEALGVPTPRVALRALYHDTRRFVPSYLATAWAESAEYRKRKDPYAVGAITKPTPLQDPRGKGYGTYQFGSLVYRDGSTAAPEAVIRSTVARFSRWPENPFGAELRRAIRRSGPGGALFDQLWKDIAKVENRRFGLAQEAFLEQAFVADVRGFMDQAEVSAEARRDDTLFDVVVGTIKQYGPRARTIAEHVARTQSAAGRELEATEVGLTMQDFKSAHVAQHFAEQPAAWRRLRQRISHERALFEGP